jgi:hypothetical protein
MHFRCGDISQAGGLDRGTDAQSTYNKQRFHRLAFLIAELNERNVDTVHRDKNRSD